MVRTLVKEKCPSPYQLFLAWWVCGLEQVGLCHQHKPRSLRAGQHHTGTPKYMGLHYLPIPKPKSHLNPSFKINQKICVIKLCIYYISAYAKPFLPCGKEDIWVLGIEPQSLSYVWPPHWAWREVCSLLWLLQQHEWNDGNKGEENVQDNIPHVFLSAIHILRKHVSYHIYSIHQNTKS